MIVNTYDAKPMYEEILNASKSTFRRTFNDGSMLSPLWQELEPGLFWVGDDSFEARDVRTLEPKGVTLEKLRSYYPKGRLV